MNAAGDFAINVSAFTCFDEWPDAIEQALEGCIVLLALDEFEALDKALSDKRFDETGVLGMLRNLIQHRPRFKIWTNIITFLSVSRGMRSLVGRLYYSSFPMN